MQMKFFIQQFDTDAELSFSENISWLVIHGQAVLNVENTSCSMAAGDFIRLPVGRCFLLKVLAPLTVGAVHVFDIVATRKECEKIPASEAQLIRNVFFLALWVENFDNPNKSKIINATWQLMWEAIIGAGVKINPANAFVGNVLKQINDSFQDSSFDLGKLIEETGYSPGHFRKMFKEEVGVAPVEHLNLRRLEYAKKMMWQESGKMTIKAVAESSGFSDANNFSKFFKRTMGITPGEYLKKVRSERWKPLADQELPKE